jgi:ribulose-phosphate 3-epimerase
MVTDPDRFIAPLIQAGADRVVFHYEAVANPEALLKKIQSSGKENGLSIKPATPFSAIKKWLPILDCILVMTVEPGFGGQPFMSEMLPKIREIKDCIRRAQSKTLIAVDGGINLETARLAAEAGADILIAGAAIFNAPDPGYVMRELKALG